MAFLKTIADLCDVVAGWIWALVCAALLIALGGQHVLLVAARHDAATQHARADQALGQLTQLQSAVVALKKDAAAKLKALQDEVADWQAKFNDARRAQEIKDGNAQAANDKAARDLRAAAARNAGRLRDPNSEEPRCGGGGGSAQAGSGGSAGTGTGNATEGGGLFSERASELLQRLTQEADDINRAYASCRADAYQVRGLTAPK
jgi:hypothetical protein